MASSAQTMEKLLRNLRDNGKVLLQCGALTYIRSNAQKLENSSALSKEEYAEICKLVMNMATSNDRNTRSEGLKALHSILKFFKSDELKFFESALQIDRAMRLEIFQCLETADDSSVAAAAQDPTTLNFMEDCLSSVQTSTMEWLLPTSCTDNLQLLLKAENVLSANANEVEIVNKALALLQRLYKIALNSADIESVHKFDALVVDKVLTLAYMGHKRQRGPAIRLLLQAIEAELGMRLKTKYTLVDAWKRFKNDLQGPYTTRMTYLVKACDLDWSHQWCISIKLLGSELHRGATLINNLLSVEERAFKSTDTMVRRQAFVSWKLLIENFALDMKELATPRRVKLLCVPLIAKNSRSELIALTKLEVWWYLITKLYQNIAQFADPVVTQFLNFCFGPLGDTPLMSSKVDVIASPGKRFYKTKINAIDALLQLLVVEQKEQDVFAPILTERLPSSISEALFKECYKIFLHSVGEAVVLISQLQVSEIQSREEICKVLWTNLMHYIQTTSNESKTSVYNELILVVTELQTRAADVPFVNEFFRDVIVPELAAVASELVYYDRTLLDLMTRIMVPSFFMNLRAKQCDSIKCLMWQTVRPKTVTVYHTETLKFLETTLEQLRSVPVDDNALTDCFELWYAYADIACKYMKTLQDVNEGTTSEPNFKTLESIISFPFTHMHRSNSIQAQKIAVHWKDVYKKFECQADTISSVKGNEIFDKTSKMIEESLAKNEKCYRIAVYCLDALMSTINYKMLLAQNKIPPIVRLIGGLTTIALHEGQPSEAECALKALSSLLITVYGHSPEKSLSYMKVTSQTVEMMLKTDAEDTLLKEIVSTWETIVSILRGLGNLLDSSFLLSYKQAISLSLRHVNPEISSQTLKVLEMKENLRESAKSILDELAEESRLLSVRKDTPKNRNDKNDRTPKQMRITGSFMNRKIPSPKSSSVKPREREEKKLAPLPPEPDSQDYVLIKSDIKLDVNRLTEHQKESFKRRRDDIPAMYNDLSQSSSQDTQDIQQWFDSKKKTNDKSKVLPENEKTANVNDNSRLDNKIENIIAPCEVKIVKEPIVTKNSVNTLTSSKEKCTKDLPTPEIVPSSGQDPNVESSIFAEPMSEKAISEKQDNKEKQSKNCSDSSPVLDDSYVARTKSPDVNSLSNETTSVKIVKTLNFESREEYLDEKGKDDDDNTSSNVVSSSAKANRALRSSKVVAPHQADEKASRAPVRGRPKSPGVDRQRRNSESLESPTDPMAKSKITGKTKTSTTKRSQTSVNVAERGTKRKAASDSENEANERETRRRKMSRSRSRTPENTENPGPSQMDKRTGIEMSRLRIDMVFEPLPSRRRSKYIEDFVFGDAIGKRHNSPERKTRATTGNSRSCGNLRRSSRGVEKDGTAGNSEIARKRKKATTKDSENTSEEEKLPSRLVKSTGKLVLVGKPKKNHQENVAASESQTIIDDEEEADETTSTNVESENSSEIVKNNTELNDTASINEPPVRENSELPITETAETPMENDLDEVVESSQDSTSLTSSHRRSFANIVKSKSMNDNPRDDLTDHTIEKKHPRASSPINPLADSAAKNDAINEKSTLDDAAETFLDISAIRPQLADDVPNEDTEKRVPEASKTIASPAAIRANEGTYNFSSPKGHSKRFVKSKGFTSQGRAAHMLGLVTKQAALEKDTQKCLDDEISTIKRLKMRENDNETIITKKDRSNVMKEPERIGSPGGSRQEKIFNNMKAADHAAASPPGKLFGNLKNDGEKISPKVEKLHNPQDNDVSNVKDDDDVSTANEKDELPILEWSSANPPSLTASPSVSILKRNRSIVTESEMDVTMQNRITRKRVSFADPPVSKEMGYEIETVSPHKIGKFGPSRGLLGRKDSPIRIKQSRFKMIQIDPERSERDEDTRILSTINDVDMECEKDNELLKKIAEDLEDIVKSQESVNIVVNDASSVSMRNEIHDELTENEITKETHENIPTQELGEKLEKTCSNVEAVTIEESPTQDDLFNSSDEKIDSPKGDRTVNSDNKEKFNNSEQSSTLESFKLNVTDDSVIGSVADTFRDEANKSQSLEDTIDVRNITNLNLTVNSDETFDERPVRMSTQAADAISEMDTLPITDSIFASFPTTQDSQSSTTYVELAQPELLNSTDAIYPKLTECRRPIGEIIDHLANQLWRKNLAKHLETRGIRTIGDLARLSEREIARIPVRGSSKVDFVRKVLEKYETMLRDGEDENTDDVRGSERLAVCPEMNNTTKIPDDMELPQEIRKSLGDISALSCNSKLPGNSTTLDVSVLGSQLPNDIPNDDDLDPLARHTLGRTSTKISISTVNLDPTVYTVLEDTTNVSQISTINLSSDTMPITSNSVGTCTDPLPKTFTKSVSSQTSIGELLDDIDVNLVLKSAVKRISAEKLLEEYKVKMEKPSDLELTKETMRILSIDAETMLKVACRECGLNKVLRELPDIFESDNQFHIKVLKAYRKKTKVSDCVELLDHEEAKNEICNKCSSIELLEMLSKTLKDEERRDVKTPINVITSLNGILKRTPIDLIRNSLGNNELIPASIVLDVALRNNKTDDVTRTLEMQYPDIGKTIFDRRIDSMSREELLSHHRAVCAKLNTKDLLDALYVAMKSKLN